MENWLQRQSLLLTEKEMAALARARVAVLGLGGVGGTAAEALARCGVGHLLLADHDTVEETNLNRQLFATRPALGQSKCQAAGERLRSIVPGIDLVLREEFYLPENREFLFSFAPDYILDCIDTVTAKLDLAVTAKERRVPLLMCLGTGNRLDPSQLRTGDCSETAGCGCPLAHILRRELRRRGVERQNVVYSLEQPRKAALAGEAGRHSPGSISFVPPAAGYLMASFAVRDMLSLT